MKDCNYKGEVEVMFPVAGLESEGTWITKFLSIYFKNLYTSSLLGHHCNSIPTASQVPVIYVILEKDNGYIILLLLSFLEE